MVSLQRYHGILLADLLLQVCDTLLQLQVHIRQVPYLHLHQLGLLVVLTLQDIGLRISAFSLRLCKVLSRVAPLHLL